MPILNPNQFKELVSRSTGRLLGVDVGTKAVGLALSDRTLKIASPYKTLERKGWKKDVPYLEGLIGEQEIYCLVVGLPLNMDGSEGPSCRFVRDFIEKLLGYIDIPVYFFDERFSTIAVERVLKAAEMSRKRKAEVIDKLAASYILQGALDWLQNQAG